LLQLPPLLRDAPVAVASLDLHGHIVDANRALLDASGYRLDELQSRSFAEFLDAGFEAEARTRFLALISGALDKYHAERRYRTRSGDLRDVELSVSLVRDANGQPAGCLAVLQDVTTHKRLLRDVAHRAAELEAVIQSMPAGVYVGNQSGITSANALGLAQVGLISMADLGHRMSEIAERLDLRDPVNGRPLLPSETAFVRALDGERVDYEVQATHSQTGQPLIYRVVGAPVVLDDAIAGAVVVTQDITDRRATEEALRMSETRYRQLVEQSPLSIQILKPDGTTLQVNKAWERLWGSTLDAIADYNLLQDRQFVEKGLMPLIERAFAGEPALLPAILYDPAQTLPDRSVHEDPRRWVRAVIYPLRGPSGDVREVVMIHEDITEQVRAEEHRRLAEQERERLLEQTQRAHRELQAAGRVKDEFLALLSHELRTPLNAVLGWARILRTRPIGDQTAHAVAVIERNAVAQARLIDDMLDLSRIITGKTRLQLEDVDVVAVAAGALESVRPAADAKRITIELAAPDEPVMVSADAHRVQQVFWNLLSNAVKFTEQGGRVSVTIAASEHGVSAEVTDTGIGVPPEILPIVFDRFTQGDSSSTRAHSGLGLGLAIVRHLVELHGGTVRAASGGRGKGATFSFTLPRK
jgi:PAS domain S-box-containing protein